MAAAAFLRAVELYDPAKGGTLSTYAVNCMLNVMATKAAEENAYRFRRVTFDLSEHDRDDGGELLERHETRERYASEAQRLMGTLAERERSLVFSRVFEGKTLEEIGRPLGISKARVAQLLARAMRRLRDSVEASWIRRTWIEDGLLESEAPPKNVEEDDDPKRVWSWSWADVMPQLTTEVR